MVRALSTTERQQLAARLDHRVEGEVFFDRGSRGRYSTDASIYQIQPIGVVIPRNQSDVLSAVEFARHEKIPILPRGAGTSQCGQTVGEALVIDFSKHLNQVLDYDRDARVITVQPGMVLDDLNALIKPDGLHFPVDVSTASQATIGGMTGNNSCGARSIRYGNMVHNVLGIQAVTADGLLMEFGDVPGNLENLSGRPVMSDLVRSMRQIARDTAIEENPRWPKLLRRVGGYNLDSVSDNGHNMAHLLVGSEGTLATFTRIELALQPIPAHRVLGICHFPTFYAAMEATRQIVELDPSAVELVDRTMIELAREIPLYATTIDRLVRGKPQALLLVEFAGSDENEQLASLSRLGELMHDLGFPGAIVEAKDTAFQQAVWEVRKAGLNIMMSMKGDGKPVSFIEDCAVALEDLAEYTRRLDEVFARHGTTGTWYAHASVGCLHVRPILNMKDQRDVGRMRTIAEEAFAMVREYKGSHSGEHGDGLVRSEFHEPMFGATIVRAFEQIKHHFDPDGLLNPGKIVRPPRMDDRSLFRFKPGYRTESFDTALDWSGQGGFPAAIEMCNNNGACRKRSGVMCPSFRATRDEKHVTRGRANSLRLALSGQLGPEALTSGTLFETMDLCIGCKGCKRECPTGVDMARMKMEFLSHYRRRNGLKLKDWLIASLPRLAPTAAKLGPLLNLRNRIPELAVIAESLFGFSARRPLPVWRRDYFRHQPLRTNTGKPQVALLVDTFNTWFEPENARAAIKVLEAAGYEVQIPLAADRQRPLCCGRPYLATGLVDDAKAEARRSIAALLPFVERSIPIVGLEPSCLLTFRDELRVLVPGEVTERIAAGCRLFEEFVRDESAAGRFALPLKATRLKRARVHPHCHQKALGAADAVATSLSLIPELVIEPIEAGCCGMAGAFGYEAEHYDISMQIAELELLPAVRASTADSFIVAPGTSCRHQIHHGTGKTALHPARVLESALPS